MEKVLAAERVRKTYGETVALAGVSLSVERGEVVAVVGPNGAGKTTLVRCLTGTITPEEGSVTVFGEAPGATDRSRIGVLPQAFSPPSRLTARELLAYYGGLYDDARDVESVLAAVGLDDGADRWYERLSGGQKRRVCLGAALVNDPDVLFLDEPTTGIDPAGRRAVWDRIEALADRGATVLLTTHDMAEVERLADRVGLLADGDLVTIDAPDRLIDEHGGDSRLVVETPASTEALAGTEYRVEARGDDLVVYGVDPAAIQRVVGVLADRGVEYASLTWTQPNLEDVYLRLTGEDYAPETERERATAAAAPAGGED